MALNQAYQLHLLRIDDCPVADTNYPCFIYHDRNTLLSFVMLDRPMQLIDDPVFRHYDKMLIVRGRDARQFLQQLYDDTSTRLPEPPADEPLRHNHWLALRQLGGTVIDSATFFFQPTGAPLATSLHPDTALPMPKQLVAYLGRQTVPHRGLRHLRVGPRQPRRAPVAPTPPATGRVGHSFLFCLYFFSL